LTAVLGKGRGYAGKASGFAVVPALEKALGGQLGARGWQKDVVMLVPFAVTALA
jgi:hypothetical protein